MPFTPQSRHPDAEQFEDAQPNASNDHHAKHFEWPQIVRCWIGAHIPNDFEHISHHTEKWDQRHPAPGTAPHDQRPNPQPNQANTQK